MEEIITKLVDSVSIGLVLGCWAVIVLAAFSALILWILKLREEQKGDKKRKGSFNS